MGWHLACCMEAEQMIAREVHEHMLEVAPWVDWQGRTCDGFKHGDPEAEVACIAVAWMATMDSIKRAQGFGCNLFVTHEPTFYAHYDDDDELRSSRPAREKLALLDATCMVVYRCHDAWDVFPGLGILDSWARGLGLQGPPVATAAYHAVYEVGPLTVEELAGQIADRVHALGQNAVSYAGHGEQAVTKLAVGTGAITNVHQMVALGADCLLVTDDGICGWAQTSWLRDLGVPAIRVSHSVAEEWGMSNLADYLRRQFSPTPVHYLKIGSLYKHVW